MKKIVEKIILIVLVFIFTSNYFCYADMTVTYVDSTSLGLNMSIVFIGGIVVWVAILSILNLKLMAKKTNKEIAVSDTNKENNEKEKNEEIKKYEKGIYITFVIVEALMLINLLLMSLSFEEAIILFVIGLILFIISIVLRKKKKKTIAYIVSIAAILIIILGNRYIIDVYKERKSASYYQRLQQEEIQTFNSQFELYIGTNKSASEVSAMIGFTIDRNAREEANGEERYVIVEGEGIDNDGIGGGPSSVPTLDTTVTYTIEATYSEKGLINCMTYYATEEQ